MKTGRHVALLIAVTLLVFGGIATISNFRFDDPIHLQAHPDMYREPGEAIPAFWLKSQPGGYTPLTLTAFYGLVRVGSVWRGQLSSVPQLFYATNLLVYLASVLLLFVFLRREGSEWGALVGTLFFALHPMHVESLAWVTGLRDLLSGFFSLLCLLCYRRYLGGKKAWWLATTLAFLAAGLAKPTAYSLPLVLAVYGFFIHRRSVKHLAYDFVPWLVFLPLVFYQSDVQFDRAAQVIEPIGISARLLVALDAVAFYLAKVLLPFGLSFDYGLTPKVVLSSARILWVPFLPVVVGIYLYYRRKTDWGRVLLVGYGLFVASLFTALGLKPFIFQHLSTVADRYVYFALLGPAFIVAWITTSYGSVRRVRYALLAFVVFLGIRSWQETGVWRNEESLYQQIVLVNPKSWLGYNCLASLRSRTGDIDGAAALYQRAAESLADSKKGSPIWNRIGVLYLEHGRPFEAARAFLRSVASVPEFAEAHHNLGAAWLRLGEYRRARTSLLTALSFHPGLKESEELLKEVNTRELAGKDSNLQ